MIGLKVKYFVLKPRSKVAHDPFATASCAAMLMFADRIYPHNPELAHDLRDWVAKEEQLHNNLVVQSREVPDAPDG